MSWTITGRAVAVIAAGLLAAGAAGCSNGDDDAATPQTSTPTAPASGPREPANLGSELTFPSDSGHVVKVAVLNFDDAAAPDASPPPSGSHWTAAEVRTCVESGPTPVNVDWTPWTASDTTDGRYPSSSVTYNQFPLPQYPFSSEQLNVGECVRGWIVFPVADDATIDRIRYAPSAAIGATWSVAGASPPATSAPETTTPDSTTPEPTDTVEPPVEQPEPATAGVTAVGQPCSSPSDIGTDVNTGNDIVCVYMGSGGGNVWVQTSPIQGINNVGDPCGSTDNVSQTPAGKAIMCVNGQWTYGP